MASKKKEPKKRKGKPLSLTAISPSLTVNDIHASLAWYRDILGVEVGELWEVGGQLRGVEMIAGDVTFMIGQDDWKKGRDRVKGQGVRFYCYTKQDIDRLAERIKENGGTLAQEPADQQWGTREIELIDPDGYLITLAAKIKKKKAK